MADGNALAFHVVAPHGRGVQQHVHQVVVQEINLVDVEDAAVCGGDQSRLEVLLARLDGLFDVKGTHETVFRCPDRQVNDADLAGGGAAGPSGLLARLTHFLRNAWLAAVGTAGNHRNLGQQRSQGAHGGALGGSLLAPDQHAADARVDGIQQ